MGEREMPDEKKIAANIGQEAPEEKEEETGEEPEEGSEEESESGTESASQESESKEDNETKDESEEDESEEEESDDEDDEDEEDEEEEEGKEEESAAPQSKKGKEGRKSIRTELSEVKELMSEILEGQKGNAKVEKAQEAAEEGKISDEVIAASKELAKDMDLSEEEIAKILTVAVTLSAKAKAELPPEIQEKLDSLDTLNKDKKEAEELAHFNTEWDILLPQLKKQYPNASESQLKEARELMDKLSHSKKHHLHDIDYVLFKNGKKFGVVLGGKTGKSGEIGKAIDRSELDEEDDGKTIPIEDMTPEKARKENQRLHSDGKKNYKVHRRGTVS